MMGGLAELALEVGVGTTIHEAASQTVQEGIASCWSSCQCWRLPWYVEQVRVQHAERMPDYSRGH